MEFNTKRYLVLGAGISGISVANILKQLGADVTLNDAKPVSLLKQAVLQNLHPGVKLETGHQDESLLDKTDYLVLSPGVSIYHALVIGAEKKAIPVVSEIEVAYHLCKAPIIAITGTNGKTTTTTLIGEMLKEAGRQVVVGGNIGLALSQEVIGVDDTGIVVAEISSFQLEAVHAFRPHIAAILNLTPDHIDRHRTFETYQSMKERIFAKQGKDDYTILNYDDLIVRQMATRAPGNVLYFSRQTNLEQGIYLNRDMICLRWKNDAIDICTVDDMQIKGAHNVENAMAACAAAYLAGVPASLMAKTLREFKGVEHRIEPVATIHGVPYYNDSKATNPESAIKALEAFHGNIILIAGGRDKNTDLTDFMKLVRQKADALILIGEASERFRAAASECGVRTIHQADSFANAVALAHRLASPPQIVLLSPACASYDMFNNYEERGRIFKELVYQLK